MVKEIEVQEDLVEEVKHQEEARRKKRCVMVKGRTNKDSEHLLYHCGMTVPPIFPHHWKVFGVV